jgi:cytochrome P450
MTRTAVSDFTFKDGLRIPAGTQLSFPNQHTNWDDDVHVNAKTFDAKRWSSKRETIDPNKFHFGSVSEDSINFGAGFHACPGRFFAQQVIKLVLIQFLTEFDIKWADKDGKRPPEMVNDFSISPNAEAQILIRRKMK